MSLEAIKLLEDEHKLILRGMRVAENMAKDFYVANKVNRDDLAQILDFIKNYADEFHHKKEEDVLFVWMSEKGFPIQGGPISVMLYEHDIGRAHVKTIDDALAHGDLVDKKTVDVISSALVDFASHLSSHIFKEDNMLYPMAERLSDDAADEQLLQRYATKISIIESRKVNAHYEGIMSELEKKYGVR